MWHPRFEDFEITTDAECGLAIETRGTWLNTSMYEIVLLAIVNEVYFAYKYNIENLEKDFKERTIRKLHSIRDGKYKLVKFSEFGLRRRLSKNTHDWLVSELIKLPKSAGFIGCGKLEFEKWSAREGKNEIGISVVG